MLAYLSHPPVSVAVVPFPMARTVLAINDASYTGGANNNVVSGGTNLGSPAPTITSKSPWDGTTASARYLAANTQATRFDNAALGAGDFTIEVVGFGTSWFLDWREVNLEAIGMLVGLEPTYVRIDTSASYRLATVADATQWNYLCVQRKAGVVYVSVNNKLLGSRTDTTNYTRPSVWLASGMGASRVYNNQTIAAFRVVTGKALYDGAASPFPAAPLASVSGSGYSTVALLAPTYANAALVDVSKTTPCILGSTVSRSNGYMIFNGGVNDLLTLPGIYFSDQNFLIELKYTPTTTSHTTYPTILSNSLNSYASTPAYFALTERHAAAPTKFGFGGKNSPALYSKTDVVVGTEYTIGIMRYNGTLSLIINGVVEASGAINGSLDVAGAAQSLYIGRSGTDVPTSVTGKIRDVHIVRGTAFTGSYTVGPVVPLPVYTKEAEDPLESKVVLRLSAGNDTGRTSSIVDVKGHPLTIAGAYARTTNINNQTEKRGIYFDGASAISTPDSEDFNVAGKDMCFECFYSPNRIDNANECLFGQRSGSNTTWNFQLYMGYMSAWFGGITYPANAGVRMQVGYEYHLAWVIENGVMRTYMSGYLNTQGFNSAPTQRVIAPLNIGKGGDAYGQFVNGTLSGLRLTVGDCRYRGTRIAVPNSFD